MSFPESSPNKANDYFSRLEVDSEDGGEFIDHWDTGELLFLASSVQRSDRNWVSVARSLKLYGEQTRPADFYTPKNCALQYTKLLSEVDEDTKKKTLPRTERETSEAMLVKHLTDKRLTELAWLNQQTKSAANLLKTYAEMIENGELDDQLDDLLKNIDEKEKREEEKYVEYISKRESLNSTKKLNKSRLAKGKASKALDSKKKNSPFSDMCEDSPSKASVAEVVKNIKKEIEEEEMMAASAKQIKIKSELDTNISLNALLDTKVTLPSSVSPTSPLLTSLLRTITSTSSISSSLPSLSGSPIKEKLDHSDIDHNKPSLDIGNFSKSKESSPLRGIHQSPRPTPSSSPLLNSLLKNSPSSSTMASKDISPKSVSSPQPFFNPSSVLASAAAQQLAVATSTQSLSHQFFPQEAIDSRKTFLSSPVTSACLAAPTLSKLLEMPPSTPGRLPPLPVLDPPVISTYVSPLKSINTQLQTEAKPITPESSPIKKTISKELVSPIISELQVPPTYPTNVTEKNLTSDVENNDITTFDSNPINVLSSDIISATLEEISESFKTDAAKDEAMEISLDKIDPESSEFMTLDTKQDLKENLFSMDSTLSELLETKTEVVQEDIPKATKSEIKLSSSESEANKLTTDIKPIKTEELEDKEAVGKLIKNNPIKQTEENIKSEDVISSLLSPSQIKIEPESPQKKVIRVKTEPESPQKKVIRVKTEPESPLRNILSHKSEEGVNVKFLESESESDKSPVSKKPRLYESISPDKQLGSEDEMPSAIRRSGRKPKKNRGRASKPVPAEPIEPKDHYEFTESADESSAGFSSSGMLRYGSRIKEASRSEDKSQSIKQEPEDTPSSSNIDSPIVEKKLSPLKNKTIHSYSRGKSPFNVEEDLISDSFTSDDASSSVLTEDKLKKWDESTEKQTDISKVSGSAKTPPKALKIGCDSIKKKQPSCKRQLSGSNTPNKKERKLTGSDLDELSACSRDSEDISNAWKQEKESSDKKNSKNINVGETKCETAESHMSSSVTAESEAMDDIESLQGSITAEFSPLPVSEMKEDKDASQFGKQDWFQGASPKSSEHVSQSSEESEYESDNWDNHSVSTNKSASHSSDPQPRTKRKERESAQYKAWKKAIHIVLREASCHKYANVFLQKVTNDVAPGYSSIVYRPMDLSLIKKNIDNGVIKTTEEFHRDMLLMFQNAIMYNSSDHDVYKMAVEMQHDVMQQIMAFLTTQYNDKDEHNEPTSSLRGARTTKSQKGIGKQTSSTSGSTKQKEETE